jgi:hypothetical protein
MGQLHAELHQHSARKGNSMKIRISTSDNFYNGREAEILRTSTIAGVVVHWIRIITSGGGTIETALRDDRAILI